MENKKMNTLQRKIKEIKSKLKMKIISKGSAEVKEPNYNTSDFIWVGGFQHRTLPKKRKMDANNESREQFCSDIESIISHWNKQYLGFGNTIESPAKRKRHSDIFQVPRPSNVDTKTSTPISGRKTVDSLKQISALKSHFESGPDFKIYDDYHYPETPERNVSYKNLDPGNTPAPPLPPRNMHKTTPPLVQRTYRAAKGQLRTTLKFDFNIEQQILQQITNNSGHGLRKTASYNCLNIAYA